MTLSISIRNQCCPNRFCSFYDKSLEGNVITHSRKARRMRCKACGKTWAAYRREAGYGLRSNPQKIEAAVEMFKRAMSIRKIAEKIQVSPSTVQRWKTRVKNPYVN